MIIGIIIIVVVLIICWFSFTKKDPATLPVTVIKDTVRTPSISDTTVLEGEIFTDENGREYRIETNIIQIPRKTYIKGNVSGKYRGDLIDEDEKQYNSTIYEFAIYEAQVTCSEFRENIPFENFGEPFPKEKLPTVLPVALLQDEKLYGLNVLEPKLFAFDSISKLHQVEGTQIFGTFTAEITGYILDYIPKTEEEIVYLDKLETLVPLVPEVSRPLISSGTETGNIEAKGNYTRKEYYATNYKDTLWGRWNYNATTTNSTASGCFSTTFTSILVLLWLVFLVIMVPNMGIGLLYIVLIILFAAFQKFFIWVFRITGLLLFIVFLFGVAGSFNQSTKPYVPKPLVVNTPREIKPEITPVKDTLTNAVTDQIISRYRSWQDYDGTPYEGKYTLKLNDCRDSKSFKNNLNLAQNNLRSYDEIIYSLKERDKNKLAGLYHLFDSINASNKLSEVKFAEMVVSFVQDIPYALILEKDCNASSYTDIFTRKYLLSPGAVCEGEQRFGINTPTEFLADLKGDCDTRTLLLYTVFSHYNYDVALLSSEQYGHSIIGINLPINGTAFNYNNQRYVLWETTAPNCKPGIIPPDISNLNNWRISLKSK